MLCEIILEEIFLTQTFWGKSTTDHILVSTPPPTETSLSILKNDNKIVA